MEKKSEGLPSLIWLTCLWIIWKWHNQVDFDSQES